MNKAEKKKKKKRDVICPSRKDILCDGKSMRVRQLGFKFLKAVRKLFPLVHT